MMLLSVVVSIRRTFQSCGWRVSPYSYCLTVRALDDDGRGGAGWQLGGISEQRCCSRLGRWTGQRRKAATGYQKQTGYNGQCEGEVETFHCRFLLSVDGMGDAFCSTDVGVGGKVPFSRCDSIPQKLHPCTATCHGNNIELLCSHAGSHPHKCW